MSVPAVNRVAPSVAPHELENADSLREQLNILQTALESNEQAVTSLRKQAQQELHETEERYRKLFDNVLSGLMRSTPDGTILLANPALVEMFGYSTLSELSSHNLAQHFPPEQPRTNFVSLMERDGQVIGFETVLLRRGGLRFQARITAKAVYGPDHTVLYHEGVVEDISKRKRAELLETDRNLVLEMVIQNKALASILKEISLMVEGQFPGSVCAITRRPVSHLHRVPASSVPAIARENQSSGGAAHVSGAIEATGPKRGPIWTAGRDIAVRRNLNSNWSIPILSGDCNVLGTLDVSHPCARDPEAGDLEFLEMASRLAGIAIDHRLLYEELEYQANYDRLTKLPNRTLFERKLEQALTSSPGGKHRIAIVWIDLDRFKEINDTLGHRIGDTLLRQAALRLKQALVPPAFLARMGGDEFAVLLPQILNAKSAPDCAKDLLESLRAPFQVEGYELFVTASIGTCVHPQDGEDTATLQRNADAAMYRAKEQGRNRHFCYEASIGASALHRLELQNNLRRAIERQELELFYQPEIDLDGNLKAVEALVRWNHPRLGLLLPAEFIAIAEESGLIIPIGTWVVQEACRQNAIWRKAGYPKLRIAVNVSPQQIYYGDFVEVVRQALATSGLDASGLEIELTEGLVMRNFEESVKQMEKLRELGVSIAIDDFGTGYSSLAYLQRLPVDVLKLDRSFLRKIESKSTSSVIAAVTMLGRSLGLRVVAEGIEEHIQFSVVRDIGVDLLQGFLIGRPLPAAAASRFFGSYAAGLALPPNSLGILSLPEFQI
jgi:diguanylate cyclase (GGDEF)-like protein/PAS domain S-box-containing protein